MSLSIDWSIVASFTLLWAVIVPTPGPNSLMVTHLALTRSPAYLALALVGNVFGITLLALAALLGMAIVLEMFPWFRLAIHVLGGAYLVYVGARLLRRSVTPPVVSRVEQAGALDEPGWRAFGLGFATALSNAQAVVFITSIFAATGVLAASLATGLACIGVIIVLNTTYLAALGWLLRRPAPRRFYARFRRFMDGTVGILFLGLGARLVLRELARP